MSPTDRESLRDLNELVSYSFTFCKNSICMGMEFGRGDPHWNCTDYSCSHSMTAHLSILPTYTEPVPFILSILTPCEPD